MHFNVRALGFSSALFCLFPGCRHVSQQSAKGAPNATTKSAQATEPQDPEGTPIPGAIQDLIDQELEVDAETLGDSAAGYCKCDPKGKMPRTTHDDAKIVNSCAEFVEYEYQAFKNRSQKLANDLIQEILSVDSRLKNSEGINLEAWKAWHQRLPTFTGQLAKTLGKDLERVEHEKNDSGKKALEKDCIAMSRVALKAEKHLDWAQKVFFRAMQKEVMALKDPSGSEKN